MDSSIFVEEFVRIAAVSWCCRSVCSSLSSFRLSQRTSVAKHLGRPGHVWIQFSCSLRLAMACYGKPWNLELHFGEFYVICINLCISDSENEPLAGSGPAKFLYACTAHRQRDREKRGASANSADSCCILTDKNNCHVPSFSGTLITAMSVMILSGWNSFWYCLMLCHAMIPFRACLLRLKNTMPMKSVRNRSLFDLSEHVASR